MSFSCQMSFHVMSNLKFGIHSNNKIDFIFLHNKKPEELNSQVTPQVMCQETVCRPTQQQFSLKNSNWKCLPMWIELHQYVLKLIWWWLLYIRMYVFHDKSRVICRQYNYLGFGENFLFYESMLQSRYLWYLLHTLIIIHLKCKYGFNAFGQ